jgi:hypothetical protein
MAPALVSSTTIPSSATTVVPGSIEPAASLPVVLTGVQVQSPTGGSTQVFANLNAGQLQNIVLNSASNQTITQNTNITLTVYNFQAWQLQMAQQAISAQLVNEMLAASGLRH